MESLRKNKDYMKLRAKTANRILTEGILEDIYQERMEHNVSITNPQSPFFY